MYSNTNSTSGLRITFIPCIAARQVKQMLASLDNLDTVMEECPFLMNPGQLALSLRNLKQWFPAQDPLVILQKNPSVLLNIDESTLAADPLYGEPTTAG